MKLPRRNFLHLTAVCTALLALSRIARAQVYPTRPVRLIVPIAPGGAGDITARLMGQWLSERLGQQFVIDNRPGGGGNVGTEAVVRAPPTDTRSSCAAFNAINATFYDKLNFDFIRDIAPVAGVLRGPYVMVVNPSVPAKSVPEFIAYAKANPRKTQHGVGGHRHWEPHCRRAVQDDGRRRFGPRALSWWRAGAHRFARWAGAGHIPRDGLIDEYIRAGRLRALAVTAATRSEALPDIPTVAEFVPGFEASTWFGFGAPNATPAEIIDTLNKEINAALDDPNMKARLADLGGTVLPASPADFGKLIADETEKWAKVVKFSGAKAD